MLNVVKHLYFHQLSSAVAVADEVGAVLYKMNISVGKQQHFVRYFEESFIIVVGDYDALAAFLTFYKSLYYFNIIIRMICSLIYCATNIRCYSITRNMQDLPLPFLPSIPVTFPVSERIHAPFSTVSVPNARRMLSARSVCLTCDDIAYDYYKCSAGHICCCIK